MRSTLPLAVLCCMLAAHLAAGTRNTITTNRALLARPVATPLAIAVNLTRQQFVQATWALQDVTCANLSAKDPLFNNTLAKAVIKDFETALTASGWPDAPVVAVRQPCLDTTALHNLAELDKAVSLFNGRTYASFRVGVRFNSTNTTQVAGLCTGGYVTSLYKNVAALFAEHDLKVSQNNGTRTNMFFRNGTSWVTYAGPCVARLSVNATCGDTNGDAEGQPDFMCGAGFTAKTSAADANIGSLTIAAAREGSTPNLVGRIDGLVVGSDAAQGICCSGGAIDPANSPDPSANPSPSPRANPSPSPSPCTPSCSNSLVGVGAVCGNIPDGCGGSCLATCQSPTQPQLACQAGVCTCTPTCTVNANGIGSGGDCGLQSCTGSVPDGCGGQCARVCDNQNMCVSGTCVCKAKTSVFQVASIADESASVVGNRWMETTVVDDSTQLVCGQIMAQGASWGDGLAFKTVTQDDECIIRVAFPGNRPQETEGMFSGMPWKDFITNGGTFKYQWTKETESGGKVDSAPYLRVILVDPETFNGNLAASTYITVVFEPVYQNPRIQDAATSKGLSGCCLSTAAGDFPTDKTYHTAELTYNKGGVWIQDSDAGVTGGMGNAGYPTLAWFMQDYSTRTDIYGNNGNFHGPFFWDVAGNQFMDRAVIYAVEVGQGSYAEKVTGFVRSVRAYTAGVELHCEQTYPEVVAQSAHLQEFLPWMYMLSLQHRPPAAWIRSNEVQQD
ncbi:hypothetical protein COO60DRAFT_1461688 [Scenedesmus sp. NREL 46B-D3]|nr:hypothetical protein COO60DRAFT_1461688 [Scenedesmus sp. NREL 46B-D3]